MREEGVRYEEGEGVCTGKWEREMGRKILDEKRRGKWAEEKCFYLNA